MLIGICVSVFLWHPANYLDVYTTTPTSLKPTHSASLLPPNTPAHLYRGDTLRLRPASEGQPGPTHLFATTRGARPGTREYVVVFELNEKGFFRIANLTSGGSGAQTLGQGKTFRTWCWWSVGRRLRRVVKRMRLNPRRKLRMVDRVD
jgi:hypothetical protein